MCKTEELLSEDIHTLKEFRVYQYGRTLAMRHEFKQGIGRTAFRCIGKEPSGRKKILVKGLKGKKGNYDAYLIPESIEDFSYTKDGTEIKGSQYKFKMEFPPRNGKQG